ncbi:MAG: class I SAM-dependent methyltransferase [Gemmatimonadaceae bacterium]|nr:class I SAM-dependent methyltransferase [Gemmatimonadaceae bacterium]
MGVLGGELAYRFLRWYAPDDRASTMDGSAYVGRSKLRVLLGDQLLAGIRDKDVIDFGCGDGDETIEIAQAGARSVVGVDIQTARFPAAIARAAAAGVADRVSFMERAQTPADVIVSIDSFEHFAAPDEILNIMAALLRPGGHVFASFGPTWYHPLGGHLFSVFPWAHLLFTEAALIRWRSDFKTDGARRFGEVAGGLNQMTIGRFEQLVANSPLRVVQLEAVPIRRLQPIANAMTREFTSAIVRCTLELRPGTRR